jgi:hypothetical protein
MVTMGAYRRISELLPCTQQFAIITDILHTSTFARKKFWLQTWQFTIEDYVLTPVIMLNRTSHFCIIMTKNRSFRRILCVSSWWVNIQIYAMCYEVNNQFMTCVVTSFVFGFLSSTLRYSRKPILTLRSSSTFFLGNGHFGNTKEVFSVATHRVIIALYRT